MATRRKFIENVLAGGIGGIVTSSFAPFPILDDHGRDDRTVPLFEAQKIHDECLIFDGHNDTPVERVARGQNVSGLLESNKEYHTDFPRMKQVGYDAASFIVGNGVVANVWTTMEQTLSMIEANPDKFLLIRSSKDVLKAKETGRVGILMSIEGIAKWIQGEPDILRMLYRTGVKWVAITHGEGGSPQSGEKGSSSSKGKNIYLQGTPSPNAPCTPSERKAELNNTKGLTSFGKEVVAMSNQLGVVTDLAHINDKAFFDVLEITSKPVVVSHAGSFSVYNHYRNVTNDQIKAIAANGGVIGILLFSAYLARKKEDITLNTFIRHITHIADLVGVDHVGIGTDFDGGTDLLYTDMSQLVKITQGMMEHGFNKEEIKKIWGYNFMRVLEQNIDG
ncbi:MAG: membrane dipeptidase [Sediminicola sp.]